MRRSFVFRPCKVGIPIACAGHGPMSLEPRPDLCPRRESNPHQDLRRVLLYPLSYEDESNDPFDALILNQK